MIILIITIIILVAIILIIKKPNSENTNQIKNNNTIDLSKFTTTNYVMTSKELKFYRELKKVTDNLELTIFPQVDLERFIKVKDNNTSDRNRIKSCSIDYTIVNNKNCQIICCIELDGSSHNTENAKRKDEFRNNLFKQVNIPLYRIKENDYYNLQEIKNIITKNEYSQKFDI